MNSNNMVNFKLLTGGSRVLSSSPGIIPAYGQQQSQLQPSGGGQVVMQAAKHSNQQLQSQQNAVATSAATMNLMSKTTIGQQQVVITKPHHVSTPSIQRGQLENPRDKKLMDKKRLQDLVNEIDPNMQLDDDLEEMLMKVLSDFVDDAVLSGCTLAQHRKSNTLDVKDIKLHLDKQWNIFVPGFGNDESKQNKKVQATEVHKQRMALIRKANKK